MRNLKQNTATNIMVFMSDSLDHTTGKTGLTLTITSSKDGAAFASISPTVTERDNGWYSLALTGAMTDTLGDLAFHITATGADATDFLCRVVAGSLDADVSTRLAAASYTAPDNAGIAAIPTNPLLTTDNRLNNLDATISSRMATFTYTVPDNATISTINTKIDALESYDDTALMALVNDLRKITGNKVTRSANTITIYQDDGTTIWKRYNVANGGREEL